MGGGTCLFVAHLPCEIDDKQVHNYFSEYGNVLKVELMKDKSESAYAFVHYDVCTFW